MKGPSTSWSLNFCLQTHWGSSDDAELLLGRARLGGAELVLSVLQVSQGPLGHDKPGQGTAGHRGAAGQLSSSISLATCLALCPLSSGRCCWVLSVLSPLHTPRVFPGGVSSFCSPTSAHSCLGISRGGYHLCALGDEGCPAAGWLSQGCCHRGYNLCPLSGCLLPVGCEAGWVDSWATALLKLKSIYTEGVSLLTPAF